MSEAKPDSKRPTDAAASDSGSIRETLESITIAFILAFIFRAFIVEAFVIPTGSMAPTLLGQHVRAVCPMCGYEFTMGPRDYGYLKDGTQVAAPTQGERYEIDGGRRRQVSSALEFDCPMCTYPVEVKTLPTDAGDRILVLKYVYTLNEPTRWDVVVFKNPEDPEINYIKRLVGLPNELLRIVRGDIYIKRTDPATGEVVKVDGADMPWTIQSKPDHVQRAVWQPVYHSIYAPLDGGEPGGFDGSRRTAWEVPWQSEGAQASRWAYDAAGPHWDYADAQGRPGVLGFRFRQADGSDTAARNYYAYNSISGGHNAESDEPFQDMRVAATFVPHGTGNPGAPGNPGDPGVRVMLVCSSFDRVIRATIEPDGTAVLHTTGRPPTEPGTEDEPIDAEALAGWTEAARSGEGAVALPMDKATRVELWHVDGQVSLLVDGRRVRWKLGHDGGAGGEADRLVLGRDADAEAERSFVGRPIVRIGVQGAPVTVRDADLDRDLYHTDLGRRATEGRPAARIRDGHYFCLGDNSPQSKDGRLWDTVDAWVRHMMRHELPASDHPEQDPLMGYVPRSLMIGRAFFVYYPAPHRLSPQSAGVVPNFGRMRFIR